MKRIVSIIIVLFIIICPISSLAYSVNLTPSEVNSGETFDLTLNMDEDIYLINGHLIYDNSLFEYRSCQTSNVEIETVSENEIAWYYTELQDSPQGINQIKFRFKAASVLNNTTGNFEIDDGIYIDTDEHVYENIDFTHQVLIRAKQNLTLPITGGTGIIIFIVLGLLIMIISIILFIKKSNKEKENKK